MPATVLVREALRRVSGLLEDTTPQFYRWSETRLVDYLNDAQLALAKFLPASCARIDAIKLKPGTRQSIELIAAVDCKPGDGSTPAAPIIGMQFLGATRNMGADGLTPGRAVRITDRKTLDAIDPDWHTRPNRDGVISGFLANPNTPKYFYVTPPVPAAPSVWLEVEQLAQPIKVPNTGTEGAELYLAGGASTTLLSVSDEHVDDVVNYCVARAHMEPNEWANPQKADRFANLFVGSLNAKVMAMTGVNPNLKRLPFAPQPLGAAA
jgi:hypothetical protein